MTHRGTWRVGSRKIYISLTLPMSPTPGPKEQGVSGRHMARHPWDPALMPHNKLGIGWKKDSRTIGIERTNDVETE